MLKRMNPRRAREQTGTVFKNVLPLFILVMIPSCSNESEKGHETSGLPEVSPSKVEELLVFPDKLFVTDISVNVFVMKAMEACAAGDYDAFRLLWSVKQDPLTRDEFNQGWQAAKKIRVRALERVIFADQLNQEQKEASKNKMVFVMLADVELDPSHPAGRRKPKREAVLMILKEQDQWRLSRAPKAMRQWIKKRVDAKKGT